MSIILIEIEQDNKVNGSDLLSVDNELFFLFDVQYNNDPPEFLEINVFDSDVKKVTQRAIPHQDIVVGSKRRYIYKADSIIRSLYENSAINDTEQAENTLQLVTNTTKDIRIECSNPFVSAQKVSISFKAIRGSQQLGEYPNKQNIYFNEERTYYAKKGGFVYLYYYSVGSEKINIGADEVAASEVGLYRYKVEVSTNQDFIFSINDGAQTYTQKVEVIEYNCANLLKYIDQNAEYRFFPFNQYKSISAGRKKVGSVNNIYASIFSAQAKEYNIGYKNTNEVVLTAESVTPEQLLILSGLNEAPRIYYYIGDGTTDNDADWLLVEMTNSIEVRRTKERSADVTVSLKMPETNSIKMI